VISRGDIWWADLREPRASEPGWPRPVLIVQSDDFNQSAIKTVLAVVLTTNLRLAEAPGNTLLPASKTGLRKDSVANVSQIITSDKVFLRDRVRKLESTLMDQVDEGLRLVLGLE
jgi:mRNA interferase MazF